MLTTAHVQITGGGTLAPGLTLPRIGGTSANPTVLTPCDRHVTLSGPGRSALRASGPDDTLVVIDPGHGGHADGAKAADGTREADLVLALSTQVRGALAGHVGRVVVTRTDNIDASLGFRVALADALRADLAVSLHLDANPRTTTSPVPGAQVYASTADPHGRRAAGVIYQSERRYLDALSPRVHDHWAARFNRGALYRLGTHGDYYFLLRDSHVPWVISEAMFLTHPPEEALMQDTAIRGGLANAIAGGIVEYLKTRDPGSGWRRPRPQPADPIVPGPAFTCHDPA
ncbi:MAG: N-acetylmuramoyl-L-alanine amidase [Actinomycetes bacterium]